MVTSTVNKEVSSKKKIKTFYTDIEYVTSSKRSISILLWQQTDDDIKILFLLYVSSGKF